MSKSIHRKELIVIYRQEILKDIRLFTSQPVAKFYDSLYLNLELSFVPEFPKTCCFGFFYFLFDSWALFNYYLDSGLIFLIADCYKGMERLFENKETLWLLPRCEGKILNIDLRGNELQKYEYPKITCFD